MSKSHTDINSRILLTDSPEVIQKKLKVALTDSIPGISYEPEKRPGVSNLIEILSCVDESNALSPVELAREHGTLSLRALKELVASKLIDRLAPIRERYTELMSDERGKMHVDNVAREGAEKAAKNAEKTMQRIREAIGL